MQTSEEYYDLMDSKIDEWQAELNKIKEEAYFDHPDNEKEYRDAIRAFETKVEDARQRLNLLKVKGDAAVNDLKEGLDHTVSDLKHTFEKIVSRFSS